MSYASGTTHYNLPQTIGSDKRDWTDTNQAFSDVDAALYAAAQGAESAASAISSIQSDITAIQGKQSTDEGNITTLQGKVSTLEGTVSGQGTEINDVRRDLQDNIESKHESSATSTHAYAIGDTFYYNDVLYKATAAIAIGDTIVPNTNCTGITVMSEIQSGAVAPSAANVSYDNTTSGLTADDVQEAIDELSGNASIRYDQSTHYIQVKDNGTWYNYKYYNPSAPSVALIPTMTSNSTPSGTASASTEATGFDAYKAFDNDNTTHWAANTNANEYLQYEFDDSATALSIEILPSSERVKNFKIQGSDNGTTWVDLLTAQCASASTAQQFNLTSTGSFKYYRLNVIDNYSENVISIETFQLYGHV